MITGTADITVKVHIWAKSKADFEEIRRDLEKEFIRATMRYKAVDSARVNVCEEKVET